MQKPLSSGLRVVIYNRTLDFRRYNRDLICGPKLFFYFGITALQPTIKYKHIKGIENNEYACTTKPF